MVRKGSRSDQDSNHWLCRECIPLRFKTKFHSLYITDSHSENPIMTENNLTRAPKYYRKQKPRQLMWTAFKQNRNHQATAWQDEIRGLWACRCRMLVFIQYLLCVWKVSGVDLTVASHEQAVEAIRRAGDTVDFLIQSGQQRAQVPRLRTCSSAYL